MSKDGMLADFFDYGKIEISHRLHVNRPINHEKRIIEYGIRMSLVHKVKNFAGDDYWELQILYRDENFKTKCDLLDIDDYRIKILHKGDMLIEL
mgnify:CR=1 FL=1